MRRMLWVLVGMLAVGPMVAAGDDAAAQRASEVLLADDLNGDGKVAPDEWSEENEKFLKIDKDGNGFLTQEELTEYYANRTPGEKEGGGDGGAGDPGPAGARSRWGWMGPIWNQVDTNGDGFLSSEEWTFGEGNFPKADKDGDGQVSREEMGEYLKWSAKNDPKALVEMQMKVLDADKDGKVSSEEWKGPAEMFGKGDKDQDGFLSLDELAAMVRGRKEAIAAFKEMDTNGDGALSAEEWKGRPEMFSRMDKDGDGLVTAEEMEARMKGGGKKGPQK